MLEDRSQYAYQAYFCEENIWQLLKRLGHEVGATCKVLFFINASRAVPMAHQKAFGEVGSGFWDYHVVLLTSASQSIVDFDSTLGFETGIKEYFFYSFPNAPLLPQSEKPVVRMINGADYRSSFWSDRTHMIDSAGNPMATFPGWPPVQNSPNSLRLNDLVDVNHRDARIVDLTVHQFMNSYDQ